MNMQIMYYTVCVQSLHYLQQHSIEKIMTVLYHWSTTVNAQRHERQPPSGMLFAKESG
jgi:hypothetical protein